MGIVSPSMHFDIYRIFAATLYALRFPLAAIAIVLCVLLFRRSRSVGWLWLGVLFVEPFYHVSLRLIRGYRLLLYQSSDRVTADGALAVTIHWEFPIFYLFGFLGLYLLYRHTDDERQA